MMVMASENRSAELQGNWLALDTATDAMTIAIFKDDLLIGERSSPSERNHSNRLLPAIQELTTELGMPMRSLSGIVVGQGPGSYTGIRIGVTVAKTLAWSLRIPLIAISSLEAMAYGVVETGETVGVIPMIDARRGRAYTAFYMKSGDSWTCAVPDGIKSMEQFLDEIKAGGSGYRIILTGDVGAFLPVIASFREAWKGEVTVDERPLQASIVGTLALRYGMNRAVADVHRLLPNYTQLSEPEKNYSIKTM
ncbi:MAG: tRNA (adenosine(37)-N6)-threonylcarbamoyltransferase complex dimerization subunit type 1 TsaB [Paenibacillaceae bacterium]